MAEARKADERDERDEEGDEGDEGDEDYGYDVGDYQSKRRKYNPDEEFGNVVCWCRNCSTVLGRHGFDVCPLCQGKVEIDSSNDVVLPPFAETLAKWRQGYDPWQLPRASFDDIHYPTHVVFTGNQESYSVAAVQWSIEHPRKDQGERWTWASDDSVLLKVNSDGRTTALLSPFGVRATDKYHFLCDNITVTPGSSFVIAGEHMTVTLQVPSKVCPVPPEGLELRRMHAYACASILSQCGSLCCTTMLVPAHLVTPMDRIQEEGIYSQETMNKVMSRLTPKRRKLVRHMIFAFRKARASEPVTDDLYVLVVLFLCNPLLLVSRTATDKKDDGVFLRFPLLNLLVYCQKPL